MKRTLIALGLLVCTTGIAFAEEVATTELGPAAIQEAQIQNELNKATFDKRTFNQNPQKYKNQAQNRIKYDESVNRGKYKNFDKRPTEKFNPKKGDIKGSHPDFRNDRFNPNMRGPRPLPKDKIGHRPYRHGDFKKYDNRPHLKGHHPYNPKVGKYHNHQRNNIRKQANKRASLRGSKNIRTR